MTTIGFTGTRDGMTQWQRDVVDLLVAMLKADGAIAARHGVCTGADEDFHAIAKAKELTVIGHPGISARGNNYRGAAKCDVLLREKPFIERNHDIVRGSEVLIATPRTASEEPRSGTWATIRYAAKIGKRVIVVCPDGRIRGDAVKPSR